MINELSKQIHENNVAKGFYQGENNIDMKNPLEITQDVLNGMIGIGGIPTNQEFYDEFNDRLKAALSLHNVAGQSEQFTPKQLYMLAQKHSIEDFQKILKESPTWKG